jgi:hypothetical protein
VQAVALVLDQVSVVLPPLATVLGEALRLIVGAPATLTVTVRVVVPPGPLHARLKFMLVLRAGLASVPLVARAPLHPPLAVQAVAPLLDQASVVAAPEATVAGVALSVTLGAAGTVTVVDCDTVPPAPVQVSV